MTARLPRDPASKITQLEPPHVLMRSIIPLMMLATMSLAWSQDNPPDVEPRPPGETVRNRSAVIIEFDEDINPLSGALLERKFKEAVDADYDVIILDIHSPGGFTSVTFELMDLLLDAKDVETVAWIEKDAISGAALLSLAADKIIIRPDARIGDAGEIVMGEDGAYRYTEAKSRSVLAQKARDTAKATGRPEVLAEKMVDKDMIVFSATRTSDGETRLFSDKEWETLADAGEWQRGQPIREAGKDMFFIANGERAVELGLADHTANDRAELAEILGLREPIPIVKRTWVDTFVLVLNSGFVTFLLLVVGMIALVIELSAAGFGVGGLVSLLCFGLFFWSRFLGGTSGWLEVTLFVIGLMFIAAELFVIPGFGVSGVAGLGLTLWSLVMASRRVMMPDSGADLMSLSTDVLTVLAAFVGFLVALLFLSNYIGEIPGLSRLTLRPQVAADALLATASESVAMASWQIVSVGDEGDAISALRPSGKVQVGETIVDVVTEGDFVDAGSRVKIVLKQGSRIVVRRV